jgi:hypothetical protein
VETVGVGMVGAVKGVGGGVVKVGVGGEGVMETGMEGVGKVAGGSVPAACIGCCACSRL